ncbi:hypothetical protein HJG60_008370 [Phyllostomus discolor]|uniref:Uncharacterized protein n=1 Tax=Phyllostomus discolor TaxID=89673 RepID=A0A834DNA6_9CHIR|nr:hypothetical protein HJG60_008370 [Phyllostomus discolor]
MHVVSVSPRRRAGPCESTKEGTALCLQGAGSPAGWGRPKEGDGVAERNGSQWLADEGVIGEETVLGSDSVLSPSPSQAVLPSASRTPEGLLFHFFRPRDSAPRDQALAQLPSRVGPHLWAPSCRERDEISTQRP